MAYPTPVSRLGPRLEAIADRVLPGRPMADIGTDHARLPVALVSAGTVPRAIACDVRPGPLDAARRTTASAGATGRVQLRLGDGLAPLEPGEVATIVIAGMGGRSIVEILDAGRAKLVDVGRLVLSPNGGVRLVRQHLDQTGWTIVDETIAEQGQRLYPIVVAEPGRGSSPLDAVDLVIGPLLRGRADPLVRAWVSRELERTRRALQGLDRARDADPAKRAELEALATLLEAFAS